MTSGRRLVIDMTITGKGDRAPRDIFQEFIYKMEIAGFKVEALIYEEKGAQINGEGRIVGA